ncbi:hypothetical protein F5Y10DRAFT_153681 [Nemania abortiva]|nr:hypothetical protein F5Y10DRAFT_153681 [Nemania abortiva]
MTALVLVPMLCAFRCVLELQASDLNLSEVSNRRGRQSGTVEGPVILVCSRVLLLRNPMRWSLEADCSIAGDAPDI